MTTGKVFDPEYVGKVLLEKGFEAWTRYLFRMIEGRPFHLDPIHKDLFDKFQEIYDLKDTRVIMNMPPRSGKTSLAKYFVLYCITKNPKCNFIYTSYSQELLNQISKESADILENPVYKAMYPHNGVQSEAQELNPIDEFWGDYWRQTMGKNKYTAGKITTYAGGVILFASIGASITGFGAGIRGIKERFTGGLIIDDANKPADTRSSLMRKKVFEYYTTTLLNRLNESNTLILNMQQRLHVDDLSGYIIKEYKNFSILRKPLIDQNGECLIPSQYTKERIKELQIHKNSWLAQFQQTPIAEKGQIIQSDWWRYYNPNELNQDGTEKYPVTGALIITADTAYKDNKNNDSSCIGVWEIGRGYIRLRDMVCGQWIFPDLLKNAKQMWEKWTSPNNPPNKRAQWFFIEDKASGTSLEQTLSNEGINALAWLPKEFDYPDNKVARTREASWDVCKGLVYLPYGHPMSEELVLEASLFSEDMSHAHDDKVDTFTMAHSIWRYYGGNK
jgi:predicted phage terminase large subunit-like protein